MYHVPQVNEEVNEAHYCKALKICDAASWPVFSFSLIPDSYGQLRNQEQAINLNN